jgi:hypothetical protein
MEEHPRWSVLPEHGGLKGGSSNPLCSRNPHGEAVVVRRAQLRITGSRPYERGVTSELGGSIGHMLDARSGDHTSSLAKSGEISESCARRA